MSWSVQRTWDITETSDKKFKGKRTKKEIAVHQTRQSNKLRREFGAGFKNFLNTIRRYSDIKGFGDTFFTKLNAAGYPRGDDPDFLKCLYASALEEIGNY